MARLGTFLVLAALVTVISCYDEREPRPETERETPLAPLMTQTTDAPAETGVSTICVAYTRELDRVIEALVGAPQDEELLFSKSALTAMADDACN